MAPTPERTPYEITPKSAGAFLAALIVGVVSYLATGGNTGEHCTTCPTRAEFDALARLVRDHTEAIKGLVETTGECRERVTKHLEFSNEYVIKLTEFMARHEAKEDAHFVREDLQDKMINDCIDGLKLRNYRDAERRSQVRE